MEYRTALTPTTDNGTKIISPIPNSTLTQSPTTFTWLGDAESTRYHIRFGSSFRGHDIGVTNPSAQVSEYTVDLPIDGDPIYVSIATFLPGGAYYYRDYVYQTSNTPRATGVHFYINDHLGTPQQLVSIDQAITWAADYDAFGAATVTTELVSNNHRFPGQYFDAESGLHYNWHRFYDPETGRYTRSDPIGLGGGLNTFGYVLGNPLYYYDPTGELTLKELIQIIGIAIGLGNIMNPPPPPTEPDPVERPAPRVPGRPLPDPTKSPESVPETPAPTKQLPKSPLPIPSPLGGLPPSTIPPVMDPLLDPCLLFGVLSELCNPPPEC